MKHRQPQVKVCIRHIQIRLTGGVKVHQTRVKANYLQVSVIKICLITVLKPSMLATLYRLTFNLLGKYVQGESLTKRVSHKEFEEDLGVTIEAKYSIGEYDILILSAKESSGLKTWLTANQYAIPKTAESVL